jgi:hypothetical protein
MNKHEKPAGTPGNEVKFQAVCARIAAINDEGMRYIEEKKAIAELNYEYPLGVIQKRVNQIIAENKKAAKAAVAGKPEDINGMVAKFNEKYALISINGDVKVLREFVDKGRLDFQLMTPQAFETWTADQPKIIMQRGNSIIEKSAASVWLEHADHRKYEGGLVFEPGVKEQPKAPGAKWPWCYNLWHGWGVEPSEEGSCELFKTHLRDVFCAGDTVVYAYVWNYFAHMFQHPMEKPTTAIAGIGPPGIGKSFVGDRIGYLVGDGYVLVTSELLTGNFNGHLKDAIFTQADEATYAHDKKLAAKLKNNITCGKREINDKREKVYRVDAFDRNFFTAEKRDALPVEKDDRRMCITEPLTTHQEDTEYFGVILDELKAGGYQRLMHELMTTDLADFDCHKCPKTQARARAIQEVADVEVGFLIDMAMTLEYWEHDDDGFLEDETLIPCSILRDEFFKYANKRRLNSRGTDTKLGMLWAGAGIVGGQKTRLKQETTINGKTLHYNDRVNAYKLPNPQEMRDKLIAEHGLPIDCFAGGAEIRWRTPEEKKAAKERAEKAGEAARARALAEGWSKEAAEVAGKWVAEGKVHDFSDIRTEDLPYFVGRVATGNGSTRN